jgi:hypothetical protein
MDIGVFFLQAIPVVAVLVVLAVLLQRSGRRQEPHVRPDDPELLEQARTLVGDGHAKEAAKLIRRRTGVGTLDADGIVRGLQEQRPA